MSLEDAQAMVPPPRPPSPKSRALVQAAYYRDHGALTEAQAKVLMAATPANSPIRQTVQAGWSPSSSFSSAMISPSGSPVKPISPAKSIKRKGVQIEEPEMGEPTPSAGVSVCCHTFLL
jgi:hypothetical protein